MKQITLRQNQFHYSAKTKNFVEELSTLQLRHIPDIIIVGWKFAEVTEGGDPLSLLLIND